MSTNEARGRRILIAEDEPSIVTSLEFLLVQAGYAVHSAVDGEQALRALRALRPDLVVLDLMLPLLSGAEICRTLRADPALAGIKVLVLSAKGGSSAIAEGLALGAHAYVTKPFATQELLATVHALLGP